MEKQIGDAWATPLTWIWASFRENLGKRHHWKRQSHPREGVSGWNKTQQEESHFQGFLALFLEQHTELYHQSSLLWTLRPHPPDKVRKTLLPDDVYSRHPRNTISRVNSTARRLHDPVSDGKLTTVSKTHFLKEDLSNSSKVVCNSQNWLPIDPRFKREEKKKKEWYKGH